MESRVAPYSTDTDARAPPLWVLWLAEPTSAYAAGLCGGQASGRAPATCPGDGCLGWLRVPFLARRGGVPSFGLPVYIPVFAVKFANV